MPSSPAVSLISLVAVGALMALAVARAEVPTYQLAVRNHRFVPTEVQIPSGTKVRLVIKNEDATAEEFESSELGREKVVTGGGEITIWIGPLSPGRFGFFGDFHPETAQGVLIVR